jgi:hypothetical protein
MVLNTGEREGEFSVSEAILDILPFILQSEGRRRGREAIEMGKRREGEG